MPARTPHNLKVISGTVQPCRVEPESVSWEPLTEVPPAPPWLNNYLAVEEWQRITPFLIRLKLMSEGDIPAVATMCDLYAGYICAALEGRKVDASTIAQMRGLWADFGMTPLSRSKIRNPDTPKNPKSKFGSNGKRA